MMRFDVVQQLDAPDHSQVPDQLMPLPPIDLNKVVQERMFKFDYFNGSWLINGQTFDENRVDASIQQNTAEIWTLRNEGQGWSHPIHIHMEEGRILERNGKPIPPDSPEFGRKDTYILKPNDEIKIFMRFRDFLGKYPMHCHNVVHEDHSMMLRWDIVPNTRGANNG
jgi:FtsP/CotA-like multicopper oxidase with cupredoxin domain